MAAYYLTVQRDGVDVVRRQEFADYADAVAFTSRYYRVKLPVRRAVLKFYTEAINGQFARSYATLTRVQDVNGNRPHATEARNAAIKQENAFVFDASYLFLIESEPGREDQKAEADDGG
jgi:hypothetical protein